MRGARATSRQREEIAIRLGFAAVVGPLPVDQAVAAGSTSCSPRRASGRPAHEAAARVLRPAGRDGRRLRRGPRRLPRAGSGPGRALDRPVAAAAITTWSSGVELLAGDAAAAERELRPALARARGAGRAREPLVGRRPARRGARAPGAARGGARGSLTSERAASPDDVHAQIAWRAARAKVLASLGRAEEAERLAREAVELAGERPTRRLFAATRSSRSRLLTAARGRGGRGAQRRRSEAVRLYEAKGNVVAARAARALTGERAEARTP